MTSHVLEDMSETITNDYSSSHQAVDVVSKGNQIDDVIAVSDGVVEMVVKDVRYTNHNTYGTDTYGNFVKIKHPDGKKTLYAHLKYGSVTVSNGQTVSKGEKIGTMGSTGNAYGAHLHFEVRNSDETRANPNDYLNGNLSLEKEKIEKTIKQEENISDQPEEITEETTSKDEEIIENDYVTPKQNNTTSTVIKGLTTSNNVSSEEKNDNNTILENSSYHGGSIVDGLKGICIDSSFDNRAIIAEKNGIENYHGTYNQNVYLLKLLKEGKLKA